MGTDKPKFAKRFLEWLSWNLLTLSIALGTIGFCLMGFQHLEMTWLMIPAGIGTLLSYAAVMQQAKAWRALDD